MIMSKLVHDAPYRKSISRAKLGLRVAKAMKQLELANSDAFLCMMDLLDSAASTMCRRVST